MSGPVQLVLPRPNRSHNRLSPQGLSHPEVIDLESDRDVNEGLVRGSRQRRDSDIVLLESRTRHATRRTPSVPIHLAYELRDFPYADVNNNLHIRDEPPLQRATAQRPRVQGGQANRPYLTRLSSRLGTRRSLRHNPYDIFSNALAEHDSFFLEDDFVSDPEHLGMHTSSTVANSGPKRTTRKYKVSSSHPRPVLPGFSKDIPSPEEAASKRKKRVRKRPRGLDVDDHSDVTFPVCASCLFRLYLEEADSKLKSFTLKCGHVVCGVCMAAARRRCEDAKRNTGWMPYGGGRGKSGKGKGREIDDPDGVDENWTVCPARGCLGGTDLLANAKEPEMAPWELFV